MIPLFPNNKKGIFLPLLAIFSLLIVSSMIYFLTIKAPESFSEVVGEEHVALMNSYLDAEQDLYAVDQVVKYSLEQSLYDLYAHGGMHERSQCDVVGDHIVLFSTKTCALTEEQMLTNLEYYFEYNLGAYLFDLDLNLTPDDYDLTFDYDDTSLIVTGRTEKTNTYETEHSNYTVPFPFRHEIPHKFTNYPKLFEALAKHTDCLRNKDYNALADTDTMLITSCAMDSDIFTKLTKEDDLVLVTAALDHEFIFIDDIDTQFAINLNTISKNTDTIFASFRSSEATQGDIIL